MIQRKRYSYRERSELNAEGMSCKVNVLEEHDEGELVSSKGLITSRHYPVLDIDFGAELVPSKTAGHYHLYLDKELTWSDYERLLDVLGEVGILEKGYVEVCKKQKMTFVRDRDHLDAKLPPNYKLNWKHKARVMDVRGIYR